MAISNTYDPAKSVLTGPGSAVGNREDLTDVLTILAPEETPVLSSLNKQKANATFVEWTVDTLADPSDSGISEGADVLSYEDKFAGRARLGNYVQKFRRSYLVSDLQEAVDSVGPAKIAQAEAKAIRELKRDVEKALCSNNDRNAEDGTNAYQLRGLGSWIGGTQSDIPSAFQTPSDSVKDIEGNDLTEAELNEIITSIFRETGTTNDLMLIADTALRRDITDFSRIDDSNASLRQVNYDGGSAEIKVTVEMYQSDHGMVSIVNGNPDCMPTTDPVNSQGYIINPEYAGIHELIPMGSTRLPNQGGGERGYVDCALTLGVYHPGAHGKITT